MFALADADGAPLGGQDMSWHRFTTWPWPKLEDTEAGENATASGGKSRARFKDWQVGHTQPSMPSQQHPSAHRCSFLRLLCAWT
jgi:hypothetical protein